MTHERKGVFSSTLQAGPWRFPPGSVSFVMAREVTFLDKAGRRIFFVQS